MYHIHLNLIGPKGSSKLKILFINLTWHKRSVSWKSKSDLSCTTKCDSTCIPHSFNLGHA